MPRRAPILGQGFGSSDYQEEKKVANVQKQLHRSSLGLKTFGDSASAGSQLDAPLVGYNSIGSEDGGATAGKKVGIIGSMANLANAAIGAGVLAFPLAYQEAGLVLGPVFTIVFGTILGYTLHVISRAAIVARERTGSAGSYQEIVAAVLGPRAEKTIMVLQAVYLTGCNVCMLMIIRDQVKPVLLKDLGAESLVVRGLLPLAAWGICFPLSLIRDMSVFAWPSSLSQLGVFYSVGVVVWHYACMDGDSQTSSTSLGELDSDRMLWGSSARGLVSSLPLICFGFQCHLTFSLVYDSLAHPTPTRIDTVAGGCMLLCAALYIPMGKRQNQACSRL
jgi:sodium-coupled neutral amino acid transporter 7/8